jgi:hypothetical protein
MHFDIIEAVRQKQQKQLRSISIENGKVVVISISNGKVVVSPEVPQGLGPEEEIEPSEIVPVDD